MDWNDYELTVRNIYETLGKTHGVKIEGYGHTCIRKGKRGSEHQIDVLTSISDGVHTHYTAIECKYCNTKVNRDPVTKLADTLQDCGIGKGVIVSKKGFTDEAILTARDYNISLVELKQHNISVSNEQITKFYVHIEIFKPVLLPIEFEVPQDIEPELYNGIFNDNLYNHIFQFKDGSSRSNSEYISEFLNTTVLRSFATQITTKEIIMPENTYFSNPDRSLSCLVFKVLYSGYRECYTVLDSDYFESKVWLLMKVLFENKDYVVTLNNEIRSRQAPAIHLTVKMKAFVIPHFFSRNLTTGELKRVELSSQPL